MIRRPPRSTPKPSSAASDVYKRQVHELGMWPRRVRGIANFEKPLRDGYFEPPRVGYLLNSRVVRKTDARSYCSAEPVLKNENQQQHESLTHHGLTPTSPSKQQLVRFAASGGGARSEDRTAAVPSLEQRSASAAVSAGTRRSRPVALPRHERLVHRVHHVDVPVAVSYTHLTLPTKA